MFSRAYFCFLPFFFQDNYDVQFVKEVFDSPSISIQELKHKSSSLDGPVRLTYKTKEEYKKAAKAFGLMDDFKVCRLHIEIFSEQ